VINWGGSELFCAGRRSTWVAEYPRESSLDFDPADPSALGLGENESQDAVFQIRRDPLTINLVAQDKRPLKVSQSILFVHNSRSFGSGRFDAGVQAQDIIFQLNLKISLGRSGQIRFQEQAFRPLMDIDRRCIRLVPIRERTLGSLTKAWLVWLGPDRYTDCRVVDIHRSLAPTTPDVFMRP
jgi:hypothetical protein